MKTVEFALALEARLVEKLVAFEDDALLRWVSEKEQEVLKLLQGVAACEPQKHMYPALEAEWANLPSELEPREYSLAETLELLNLVWLMQKTAQFYQQAANHTPYPSQQIFFASLHQWKLLLRKRLEGAARHAHSRLWGELGFSPFPWEL